MESIDIPGIVSQLRTQMWVLTGLITVMVPILAFAIKFGIDALLKRIDKISDTLEVHNTKLITILTKNEAIHERLEEHNVRLGRVENDMSDLKIAYASKYSNYVKGK